MKIPSYPIFDSTVSTVVVAHGAAVVLVVC